ncbi:uncharacterized protein MYCGRDRAFT_79251 [Zymoseptoria tritici IPO323]|uniref:Uncharacterized protein n=1 Tax=Zymoseptoria tritici (strain CBS 115943 / IPO323) TaxID=336722 RepID=F9X459_ZYMTI|nr:uncharacterized protein MYCGRDRAFT_79251 [Zymoseptoria tritici IPO323]EGP90714.1 hypothetical protein MYCGRDRAFT_79251 [Zymoseptoria tritici IPO323]
MERKQSSRVVREFATTFPSEFTQRLRPRPPLHSGKMPVPTRVSFHHRCDIFL